MVVHASFLLIFLVQSKNTNQALSVTVSIPHSMYTSADASEEPVSQSLQSDSDETASSQIDVNNDDVLNVHVNAAGIPAQEASSASVTQGSSSATASDAMTHEFPSTAASGAGTEGTVISSSKRRHKKKKRSRSAQQPSGIDTVPTIATGAGASVDVEYVSDSLQNLVVSNSNSFQTESPKQKKKKKKKSKKTAEVNTGETHNQDITENGKSAVEPTAEVKFRQSVGRETQGKDKMEQQVSLIERGAVQDRAIKKAGCALPQEKLDGSSPKSFKTVKETTPSVQSVQHQHTLSQPKRYNNDMKGAGSPSNNIKKQPHKKSHVSDINFLSLLKFSQLMNMRD